MITSLDTWLGKHLFQPPIILICQLTGISQFAFYRYGWWVVSMWSVVHDARHGWSWALLISGPLALAFTITAAVTPDKPVDGNQWFRCFVLALIPLDVAMALSGHPSPVALAILFAEYALTIRTIPPRETRVQRFQRKEQSA